MTVREITMIPAPILREKLAPVPDAAIGSPELKQLIQDMRETMVAAHGVGLAANQIGENVRIFVVDKKLADENSMPNVFINPELTELSRETDELDEGCLSIPQFYGIIRRSKKVKIKATSETGEKIKFKVRGFLARVLQHEMDHLDGTVIQGRLKK